MRHYRNDTLIYLNKNKNREANRIIQRFNLVDDFFNPRGNFINFSSVKKIRAIIITSIILLIIVLIIILFLVFYNRGKEKKIHFDKNYFPKDRLLGVIYNNCSVSNCGKCIGNSTKNICISCIKSYKHILNEDYQIIACEYNPPKEEDRNITLNKSEIINFTENFTENIIELTTEDYLDIKLGIKSELPIENISINTPKTTKEKYLEQTIDTKINNLEEIKSSSIIDINFQNDSHKESESITERITYNISGIKSEFTTVEFSDSMTTIASGTYKEKRTIKISEFEIDKTDIFFIDELTTNVNIETEFKSDLFKNISDSVVIINCEPGYFLPEGDNKECKPCSEIGCEICHGDISFDYCDSCFSNYIPKYIHNYLKCGEPDINCAEFDNKTYECLRCKDEYVLNEGKCYTYSFSGLYHTNENNKRVKLITLDKNYIEKIIVENETVNATNPSTFIDIPKSGDHQVYFLLTNNPKSLSSLFEGCNNIVSVSFSSKIKTENIIIINQVL